MCPQQGGSNKWSIIVKFHMRCPYCGNRMEAEEEWIGHAAPCPICRTEIVIRKNDDASGAQRPPSSPLPERAADALPVAGIVFLYLFMLIPGLGFLTFISCTILYFCWNVRQPEKAGKLIRHTLIAALIAIPATLFLASSLFFPPMDTVHETGQRRICQSHIKQILLAAGMYSEDSSGSFPDRSGAGGFEILRKMEYLTDPQVFVCPLSGTKPAEDGQVLTEDHVSYLYIAGFRQNDDPDQAVILCPHHRNCVPIGRINGSVHLKPAGKKKSVHEILEETGILKQFDAFPEETKRYIRKKLEE